MSYSPWGIFDTPGVEFNKISILSIRLQKVTDNMHKIYTLVLCNMTKVVESCEIDNIQY